jgi:hypothetical protein
MADKIEVRAVPNCRNCLGSGIASTLYAGVTMVCSCVTEQLRIITVKKDYSIKDRYKPGKAEYVEEKIA